jgi:hypothetical protein
MAGSKPHYLVRAKQNPDSEFYISLGVGWNAKDGAISVKLHSIPTNWNGDMLLLVQKESAPN